MEENSFLIGELILVMITLFVAVLGAFMCFKPPTYRNGVYGYRTVKAFKSREAWFFAQKFSGKWLCITMLILAVLRVLMVFYNLLDLVLDVGYLLLLSLVPIIIVVITEKKLKSRENKED